MRKLILFFILIALVVVPLSAATTEEKFVDVSNTVKLSATVTNCVFVGVTKSPVTSSIVPASSERVGTTETPISFSFDPYTKTWNTSEAYIYVISFIKKAVTVTLTPAQLSNGSATLPFTLNIIPTSSAKYCESIENESSTNLITLVEESSSDADYLAQPRVMSWQFKMSIDADANGTQSTTAYSAEFILKISAT